ncbi:hypothetical protein D3C85_14080 [compost metagenome]
MESNEKIKHWLSLQPGNIRNGVSFVPVHVAGPMYHLSLDGGIKKFTPFVTRRASLKENITVPRVSVATSVLGCFVGYMAAWGDMLWPELKDKKFKNGWYLYDIGYEYAVKPNTKLLFDQENSDEHWLVTYTQNTREYRGDIVAKIFWPEMKILTRTNSEPDYEIKMMIEVMTPKGLLLGKGFMLTKGCWMIEGPDPAMLAKWDAMDKYKVTPISFAEYAKAKNLSADMLSLKQPAAFKW